MRLQKFLARAGIASRRACEKLISAGRVQVNGEVVTELGSKVNPVTDLVLLDEEPVELPVETTTIMLNKPAGFLSAMSDAHGGRCVSELVPVNQFAGLYPVGRLDKDTTGLLLFTNNGELGNALIHPRHHVSKTYRVLVAGSMGPRALKALAEGVMLDDGMTQPAKVKILERTNKTTLLELTIFEGRNRQVRRMGEAVNHPVLELERIALGPLRLGDLERGAWRELTSQECCALLEVTGLSRDRMNEQKSK